MMEPINNELNIYKPSAASSILAMLKQESTSRRLGEERGATRAHSYEICIPDKKKKNKKIKKGEPLK